MLIDPIELAIRESIATKERLLAGCADQIRSLCEEAVRCLRGGGKILFCGNGGSSCDAAHAAGELVGWFMDKKRKGYPAIALGHETPALTAIANDVGFEEAYARQAEALGRPGDLLVGISTSGGSPNVIRALERARACGLRTAALTGGNGGRCAELADVSVRVPSAETPRIQESHLLVVHILCAAVEAEVPAPGGA
jgi:D-sedoheptulose 7-phosphate isomerase